MVLVKMIQAIQVKVRIQMKIRREGDVRTETSGIRTSSTEMYIRLKFNDF